VAILLLVLTIQWLLKDASVPLFETAAILDIRDIKVVMELLSHALSNVLS